MKNSWLIILVLSISLPLKAQTGLSLKDAIQTGLKNRHSLLIVHNEAEIAAIRNNIGHAGFLPSVSLEAGRNASIKSAKQRTAAGSEIEVNNAQSGSWNAGAYLNWTLFDGFGMFVEKDRLGEMQTQGETRFRLEAESTVASIITTYYAVIQQEEVIRVMKDATALSRERVRIAKAKSALGAGARPALLQATVDLNTDSARLINETAMLLGLKAELNRLMGNDPVSQINLTDTIPASSLPSFELIWEAALANGNELMIAQQAKRLSDLRIRSLQSQLYPRLDFNTGYSFSQSNAQTGYFEYNRSIGPSYGITLSYPIFNGFTASRELDIAEIDLRSENLRFEDTKLNLRTSMYALYNEYLTSLDLIQLENYNLGVAQENVDVAMEKYKLGAISDIELRETQKKLIESQFSLLSAKYKAVQAETELLRLTGKIKVE